MTVSYTISNQNNVEEVGLGTPDPLTSLNSIYGNANWSFDLNFTATDGINPGTITDIVPTLPSYVDNTVSGAAVTLTKNSEELFPGSSYNFVVFGNTAVTAISESALPSANTAGLEIVGWDTPSVAEVTASYSFEVTYDVPLSGLSNQTETLTLSQELIWDHQTGLDLMLEKV